MLRNDEICSTSPFYTHPDLLGRATSDTFGHVQTCSDVFRHVYTTITMKMVIEDDSSQSWWRIDLSEKRPAGEATCRCSGLPV